MPQNPFVYGEVVPAAAFVDREAELDRLSADLLAGQKVFLISPRRYGKSSLVRQALRSAARGGALTVDVTVSSYSSYVAFLEGYARSLVSVETRLDRARTWLRDLLGAVRPEVRIDDAGGRLELSFPSIRTDRDVSRLAGEVFALPGRIAEARGRRMTIALDEFQAIGAFNGGSVEHALRAAVQHQRQVGYVFSGSEPSLMERMLGRSRPFYNLPYDVQRLAHELWDDTRADGRRTAGLEDLHVTLKRLLGEHQTLFEGTWQRLTLAQRGALRAAVLEEGRELLSADVRARYRLSGASTVQASLAALVREDVLAREGDRYVVVDSLFREWVARQTF
ncbi:MAG: ATP-binding protein [Acidobacteria bacterium]|nr:ATP-binding protein [Acidobacteriota bacterium]